MSEAPAARPPAPWHLGLWFAAATASTMCGIGGGLFAVPILHFLQGVPLKTATATSLVSVFAMTLAGTLAELAVEHPALHWPTVLLLCLGGAFGAAVGQRAAQKIEARALTWLFALALCAGGLRLLLGGPAAEPGAGAAVSLDAARAALVVAAGFTGGFVAPLLGIGGGMIVVPALFLGVPGMGYLGARACSTAMSAATAAQLTVQNLREDRVHRASVVPFSVVAALGAAAGIALVHRPGWSEAARILLGSLMLAVACKYAWAGLRARRPA